MNPGGSVKDRVALEIVQEALREGRLRPGGLVTEGTVGSTGQWAGASAQAAAMPWHTNRALPQIAPLQTAPPALSCTRAVPWKACRPARILALPAAGLLHRCEPGDGGSGLWLPLLHCNA